MRILITGGTGFIGTHLTSLLINQKEEHEIIIPTRSGKQSTHERISFLKWKSEEIPEEAGEVDVVINLAGQSIADESWTTDYKLKVLNSRIRVTQACVEYINRQKIPPKVFISASGINYYGGYREELVDEQSSPGDDFIAEVCIKWEKASEGANCRTVNMRIANVLDKDEGMLPTVRKPHDFYVGGRIGSGKQGFPFIHIQDLVRAINFVIRTTSISGPVNTTAPQIITQQKFAKTLGSVLGRPTWTVVPKFMLKLLLGERSILVWGGVKAQNKVLDEHGFKYFFPTIREALEDLLHPEESKVHHE